MALYVGALSVVIARRGWLGAAPLGIVLALAAKPAILPFAIWLLLTRPRDALRVAVVALAACAVVALMFGPGRFVEYLEALPRMTTLATSFTGNVGLVTLSPVAGLVGIVAAVVLAIGAALRLDARRGAAVALAAMLLAQPTIGFNYAGLLYPALVLLWGADRPIGTLAFVLAAPLILVSPVAAALVVIAFAVVSRGSTARPTPVTLRRTTKPPAGRARFIDRLGTALAHPAVMPGIVLASAIFVVAMTVTAAQGSLFVGYDAHAYYDAAALDDPYRETHRRRVRRRGRALRVQRTRRRSCPGASRRSTGWGSRWPCSSALDGAAARVAASIGCDARDAAAPGLAADPGRSCGSATSTSSSASRSCSACAGPRPGHSSSLTKITPGIGSPVVRGPRRSWRALALALLRPGS